MAPIKFEEHIREKLQERELPPSKTAWDKLEAQLESHDDNRGGRFHWLSIAAALAALFVIGSLVYNPVPSTTEMLVEESPSEGLEQVKTIEIIPQELSGEDVASEELIPEAIISEKKVFKKSLQVQKEQQDQNKKSIAMVEIDKVEKDPTQNTSIIKNENSFENSKIDEVVAQVKEIQKANNSISVDEVEALLIAAQRDIKKQRFLDESTQKVDAAALLLDVEFELERGFRDKVFDALGEGFQKIRTAVTERNN
jgi:hypothetical protein